MPHEEKESAPKKDYSSAETEDQSRDILSDADISTG